MKIAIVGRPNVGKSTLFNRLAGQKSAIVGDIPGITRDRKLVDADLCGIELSLWDTPGIDPFSKNSLAISMNEQSLAAIKESDAVFFLIDAAEGVTEYDKAIASWIRRAFKKVGPRKTVLIKNKSEGKISEINPEILGFGDGIAISAEHNLGMNEIYSELSKCDFQNSSQVTDETTLKIAIVGRPNVGKSTLINAIVGEDRLLTSDQAGITRDSISLNWRFKNQPISLIDTAGQRKKSKVIEKIEAISILDTWKHVRQANIVVVLMDIQNPLEKQDITIARKALDEGKIIIFALNKSDIVDNPDEILQSVEHRVVKEFAQLPGVACLLVSAKEKKGLARIFNTSLKLYDGWSKRISTGTLNKWFRETVLLNPPPLVNGMPIKLKYISQTNCKPPTFMLFANRVKHIPVSYERYLLNHMRKSFSLYGVPLRIFLKQQKNPYDK
ncbi:MAG: ribosome biogenesis GTPase Der [Holosporaceae bacterium]|jgi:GTP-binding protein|nr:ribosome biogenesis GTPase Der [Holosporaceae bacterium]